MRRLLDRKLRTARDGHDRDTPSTLVVDGFEDCSGALQNDASIGQMGCALPSLTNWQRLPIGKQRPLVAVGNRVLLADGEHSHPDLVVVRRPKVAA